jgi:hypothetical protein
LRTFVRVRDAADTVLVKGLIGERRSDSEIARVTGIPRTTIRRWRRSPRAARPHTSAHWRPDDPRPYAYLLGVYLGDGCIDVRSERSAVLMLALDGRYPLLVSEAERAMRAVFGVPVGRYRCGSGGVRLQLSAAELPYAFPQHGPGKKHLRPIALARWQASLTGDHPEALVRGLMHSDGCRSINRFSTRLPSGRVAQYSYTRYFFTNLSSDIRRIFCEHCEMLGIRWTQSSPKNISIADHRSVEILDSFVGPKR